MAIARIVFKVKCLRGKKVFAKSNLFPKSVFPKSIFAIKKTVFPTISFSRPFVPNLFSQPCGRTGITFFVAWGLPFLLHGGITQGPDVRAQGLGPGPWALGALGPGNHIT